MTLKEFKNRFDKIYRAAEKYDATNTQLKLALFNKDKRDSTQIDEIKFMFGIDGFSAEIYPSDFLVRHELT